MPNWVKNKVRAVRPEDTKALVKMLVKTDGDSRRTNFNGIIPMPEELANTPCEFPESAMMSENKKKYGYASWYDFAYAEWGTKWDGLPVDIYDDVIEFESAWAIPIKVYEEIGKTIPIIVAYADEDSHSENYGIVKFDADEGFEDITLSIDGNGPQISHAIWGCDESEESSDEEYSSEVAEVVNNIIYNKH